MITLGIKLRKSREEIKMAKLSRFDKRFVEPKLANVPIQVIMEFRAKGWSYAKIGQRYGTAGSSVREKVLREGGTL